MFRFKMDNFIPSIQLTREISFCWSKNQILGNLSRQNMAVFLLVTSWNVTIQVSVLWKRLLLTVIAYSRTVNMRVQSELRVVAWRQFLLAS